MTFGLFIIWGGYLVRKVLFFLCFTISLFLLSACGSNEEMMEYVDVSFSGMDTKGSASYSLDETRLIETIFELEGHHDYPDYETAMEAEEILSAYQIMIEPEENLSNGDEVQLTILVDGDKTKKIVGGEKTFKVEGLDEPKVLTTEDVEKKLVLNFNGVSGRGIAQIDNIFDESPMNNIYFEIENEKKKKNGDKAEIILDEEIETTLNNGGYILADDFHPTFEVKNLAEVAEKATDIKNLEDIERFLLEELNNNYQNTDYQFGSNTLYDIEQETLMYRQFNKVTDDEYGLYSSVENHGNLIGIFAVEQYQVSGDGEEKNLQDKFTVIYGFSGIILDENNKANLSELIKINEQKNDNYSLESVIQLYEGDGYEEVKK